MFNNCTPPHVFLLWWPFVLCFFVVQTQNHSPLPCLRWWRPPWPAGRTGSSSRPKASCGTWWSLSWREYQWWQHITTPPPRRSPCHLPGWSACPDQHQEQLQLRHQRTKLPLRRWKRSCVVTLLCQHIKNFVNIIINKNIFTKLPPKHWPGLPPWWSSCPGPPSSKRGEHGCTWNKRGKFILQTRGHDYGFG